MGVKTFQIKGNYTLYLQYLDLLWGVKTFQIKGSYTTSSFTSCVYGVKTFQIKGSYTYAGRLFIYCSV